MTNKIKAIVLTIWWASLCFGMSAQNTDSVRASQDTSGKATSSSIFKGIIQQAMSSIKRSVDTAGNNLYYTGKSEEPYMPYEGKIIRQINIEALDFERNFSDTSIRVISAASRIANKLHINTRDYVIRNNLFIKEKTPLNAYKIADNERYLRTLGFIHDARILIQFIPNNPDSIDLLVVTKDFFNISADEASDVLNHIHINVTDANLLGTGQGAQVSGLYDYNRSPNFGSGLLYKKNYMGNSFISAAVGVSSININPFTKEEETNEFVSLSRPLVSPYLHFAGGLLLSHSAASNIYSAPDSVFYKYSYNVYDGWIGYNLGIDKLLAGKNAIRDRTFLSLRYFNYNFDHVPYQVGNNFDPFYNNRQAVLGQLTFFRQDYYKTQYIYGFGTTEDLPYGYNVSMTTGYERQLGIKRPYLGFNALRYIATNRGDFIQLFFRTGAFLNNGQRQDESLLIGSNVFSRLMFWNDIKIRQFINFSYASVNKRVTYAPLRIDNTYGIRGILTDSAYGDKRITLQTETEYYLKYKLAGFQFAPFTYADCSVLKPQGWGFDKSNLYSGIGGGIRTRNENFVFGTIELRFYYYPVRPDNTPVFKIVLNSDIRFRYNSNYITAPDLVQLNME